MKPRLTPHGKGFSFIDRFEKLGDSHGKAWKYLPGDAAYFADHFPGNPIMPAVLIAEIAAQAAGTLWMSGGEEEGRSAPLFLAGIERFRILGAVLPEETICTEVRLLKELGSIAQFEVECWVADRVVAKGQIIMSRQLASAPQKGFR